MKMKNTVAFALLFATIFGHAQLSGNQIYRSKRQNENYTQNYFASGEPKSSGSGNQSVYRINILNNVAADSYRVTFGLNQEGVSPKECNEKINKRISGFKKEISKIGVSDNDVYVDFISQTKIYDYVSNVSETVVSATQKEVGFEMKKNVILRFTNLASFDDLVSAASEFGIHNIVKIDYIKSDTKKIYDEMFAEATKILETRRKLDNSISNSEFLPEPQITVNFQAIQPGEQYAEYTAAESGQVTFDNDYYRSRTSFVKQETRKSRTFYFDSQNMDFFDKILNAESPIVNLQYVMRIEVTYTRKPKQAEKVIEKDPKIYYVVTPNGEVRPLKFD